MLAVASRARAAAAWPPASSACSLVSSPGLPTPTRITRVSAALGARMVVVCPTLPRNSATATARLRVPPDASSAAANRASCAEGSATDSATSSTRAPAVGKAGWAKAISSIR